MYDFDFANIFNDEEQEYFLKNSKSIKLTKDSILFYQGDICSDILFLEEGKVKLSIYADSHDAISLYEISKGELCIVNISSTLSKTPAIATAHTMTDIKGRLVSAKIIRDLMISSSSYQEYIFSLFALKFCALTTLIEDIKFKRLDTRLVEFLKSQNEIMVEITHEELASKLDTSRVVVSRILKNLENKNIIKLHRKKIEVLTNNS
jgi:CRP/FNR family transcriptional regulator